MLIVKRIGLCLASLLLALLLAECVIRLLGIAPGYGAVRFGQCQTSIDPELLWVNTPGSEGINQQGMRGPELEKPKRRSRILLLGDSIVFGIRQEQEETIPVRLGVRLAERGLDYEVLNGGVTGYNTIQEARWLEVMGKAIAPDHVFVVICINDTDSLDLLPEGVFRRAREFGADEALERIHSAFRHSPLERLLFEYSHLARLLHITFTEQPKNIIRGKLQRQREYKEFSNIREGVSRIDRYCRGRGITFTVVFVTVLKDLGPDGGPKWLRDAVRIMANDINLPLIDLLTASVEYVRRTGRRINERNDAIHPNAEGADLFTGVIARWVEEHLSDGG